MLPSGGIFFDKKTGIFLAPNYLLAIISYMIYNEEYKIKFYCNSKTYKSEVFEFIESLDFKSQAKIYKYLDYLRDNRGCLDEPYTRHIKGKIRELRVDFSNNHYRLFYFLILNKVIIVLSAYLKKSNKAPKREIKKAELNYYDCLDNLQIYEN